MTIVELHEELNLRYQRLYGAKDESTREEGENELYAADSRASVMNVARLAMKQETVKTERTKATTQVTGLREEIESSP